MLQILLPKRGPERDDESWHGPISGWLDSISVFDREMAVMHFGLCAFLTLLIVCVSGYAVYLLLEELAIATRVLLFSLHLAI